MESMNDMSEFTTQPDYDGIKSKQLVAWASGDYARIGVTLQIVGEQLAEAVDFSPNANVLDVAAGNGNATLACARRWARVTSTDYVAQLLDKGRERAEADGLDVTFQTSDAENLSFGDNSFDAVVSTFGVMFAPNQAKAASELVRVCRSGGKIGLANWTPEGFIGQLFQTLGRHLPPPEGLKSPALWGTEDWIEQHFAAASSDLQFTKRTFMFRYPSPDFFIDLFRTYYGPVHKAFLALDGDGQRALNSDLQDLVEQFNTATDGSMRVPGEYGEIVITVK